MILLKNHEKIKEGVQVGKGLKSFLGGFLSFLERKNLLLCYVKKKDIKIRAS
jgi:hypothetical protein